MCVVYVYYKVFIQRVLYVTEHHDKALQDVKFNFLPERRNFYEKSIRRSLSEKKMLLYLQKAWDFTEKKKCTVIKITSEAGASKL